MSTSVLFYETERGEQPIRAYLDRVGRSGQAAELANIQRRIDLLVEFGVKLPSLGKFAKPLAGCNGLFQLSAGQHRIAYAEHENGFVLLHAWRKTKRRATRDIRRARKYQHDWQQRHQTP